MVNIGEVTEYIISEIINQYNCSHKLNHNITSIFKNHFCSSLNIALASYSIDKQPCMYILHQYSWEFSSIKHRSIVDYISTSMVLVFNWIL